MTSDGAYWVLVSWHFVRWIAFWTYVEVYKHFNTGEGEFMKIRIIWNVINYMLFN